ncbi:MAG: T9SS type A sorting domain-containing protein [Bacteroidota bacterium]
MPVRFSSRLVARRRLAWLRRSAAAGTLTLAMLRGAPVAEAQAPVALSEEFQVNTFTTGDQSRPSVAMDADGDFVIAWAGFGQDGSLSGIFAQRYAADGTPQGDEFQVNTFTTASQFRPSVGMDTDGNFVVAWESSDQDGSSYGVFARRYAADGTPQGDEFQVNTFTTDGQRMASVGMDADGDFVVAWESFGQDGSYYGVFAQRYAANGTPQGSEFQVNIFTTRFQSSASVGIDADGDFVIAWESSNQDGSGGGIFARRYAADGTPQSSEFRVNTHTSNHQGGPAVSMEADGDFVTAWRSSGQDGSRSGVFARRYTDSPLPAGDEMPLPVNFALDVVFSNPFSDAAAVHYALPTAAAVRLTVTDLLGRTVLTRAEGVQPAGRHEVQLALDNLLSGVYVVCLNAAGANATQRVILIR